MNGEIIIHTILIRQPGEQQYFQLHIPRDVSAITGIGTAVQLIDVPQVSNTGQVGQLQLQATGRANGCYNTIVKLEPIDALKMDLGLTTYQAGFSKPNALLKNGLAHRGKTSPENIALPPCNCFYGNYKDLLGARLAEKVSYRVSLTIWTTKRKL